MSIKNPLQALHDALGEHDSDISITSVIDAIEKSTCSRDFQGRVVRMIPDEQYDACPQGKLLELESKAEVMWYWWRLS